MSDPFQKQVQQLSEINVWYETLPHLCWGDLILKHGANGIAVVSVDMINGFAKTGPLSSPRVGFLIPTIVQLIEAATGYGVSDFAVVEDNHTADSVEFSAYPPHAVIGTGEENTISEYADTAAASLIQRFPKNSIQSWHNPDFLQWVSERPEITCWIMVGNCTDLCLDSLAFGARLYANQHNLNWEIVVPTNCVDTYSIPVDTAIDLNLAYAHEGDFWHRVFLYRMAANQVTVVSHIKDDAAHTLPAS